MRKIILTSWPCANQAGEKSTDPGIKVGFSGWEKFSGSILHCGVLPLMMSPWAVK
jgi:hypothetical protein